MKRLNTITLAGFAVCGFLLAMKALDLVEAGITLLLVVHAADHAKALARFTRDGVLRRRPALGFGRVTVYRRVTGRNAAERRERGRILLARRGCPLCACLGACLGARALSGSASARSEPDAGGKTQRGHGGNRKGSPSHRW